MLHNKIDQELKSLVFDFLYYYSRFEFSLKENGYAKPCGANRRAEADWPKFRKKFEDTYLLSDESKDLLLSPPLMQIVTEDDRLDFIPEPQEAGYSHLRLTIKCLQRIRNNLFHGGKHGANGEQDIDRNTFLLKTGLAILHQLSKIDDQVEYDYLSHY